MTKRCKLEFGKKGKLTKKGELCYAKNIFRDNPIRESELNYYAGKTKRKPHGLSNTIWRKAFAWAKRTRNLDIERRK